MVQVPKGWDKLVVSIVYVETGKTIAKSSKAVVRNEGCQWTETISESIRVSQDDSSKEMEDCFLKLIVSMVVFFFLIFIVVKQTQSLLLTKINKLKFEWNLFRRDQLDLGYLERPQST